MARRVKSAGFGLTVCDVNPDVLEEFRKDGVPVSSDPTRCAGADAIIVLLANDSQIHETLIGPNGLTTALPEGHTPLVLMMGTTLPATLRALQQHFTPLGIHLIDAPISGGIAKAESGTLSIMVGGDQEDFQMAKPLLEAMGNSIFYCGELGSAEVVKIINNILCVANMFLTAEALEIARHHGLGLRDLSPILSVSSGLNFLTADADIGQAQYQAWAKSEASYQATHAVLKKDLTMARKLADSKGLRLHALDSLLDYVQSDDPQAMHYWAQAGQTE